VELDKGCYRGQETVARVHNLGRPPRRLVRLLLDGSTDDLPEPGAELRLASDPAGRVVGTVGTSARHHELGPIALALVKRQTDLTATLVTGEQTATQDPLVDPEVGIRFRPAR
jgi:folate-binding Fe-S cluster repair protein YgfZ